MANPCIDVCQHDEATGWCFGCGMTRKDRKAWKKAKEARPTIRDALPARVAELARLGHPVGAAAKRGKG